MKLSAKKDGPSNVNSSGTVLTKNVYISLKKML